MPIYVYFLVTRYAPLREINSLRMRNPYVFTIYATHCRRMLRKSPEPSYCAIFFRANVYTFSKIPYTISRPFPRWKNRERQEEKSRLFGRFSSRRWVYTEHDGENRLSFFSIYLKGSSFLCGKGCSRIRVGSLFSCSFEKGAGSFS